MHYVTHAVLQDWLRDRMTQLAQLAPPPSARFGGLPSPDVPEELQAAQAPELFFPVLIKSIGRSGVFNLDSATDCGRAQAILYRAWEVANTARNQAPSSLSRRERLQTLFERIQTVGKYHAQLLPDFTNGKHWREFLQLCATGPLTPVPLVESLAALQSKYARDRPVQVAGGFSQGL